MCGGRFVPDKHFPCCKIKYSIDLHVPSFHFAFIKNMQQSSQSSLRLGEVKKCSTFCFHLQRLRQVRYHTLAQLLLSGYQLCGWKLSTIKAWELFRELKDVDFSCMHILKINMKVCLEKGSLNYLLWLSFMIKLNLQWAFTMYQSLLL